jgi:hypothetical protein
LCKEKNIELVTWNQINLKLNNFDSDQKDENYRSGQFQEPYESQLSLFRQYLFKSSRYLTNQLFNDNDDIGHSSSKNDSNEDRRKCLLIREIPNFFYHNNESSKFHDLLREFIKFSKSSLIFLFTNSSTSSSTDSGNYYKLFPSDLRKELRVVELTFNSLASSYMTKHLERICKLELFNFADKDFINNLVAASNGDLRHALNQLELISAQFRNASGKNIKFDPSSVLVKNVSKKSTGSKVSKFDKHSFENGIKDQSFGVFRGLGKVLYRKSLDLGAKKLETNLSREEIAKLIECEKRLPKKLKKFYRNPLSSCPEEILTKIPMSSDSITLYLHQNYLELFSLKSTGQPFDNTFDSLVSIRFYFTNKFFSRFYILKNVFLCINEHVIKTIIK